MLDLVWIAWFSDGTAISQFDGAEQTQEHLFREVQEKSSTPVNRLVTFELVNLSTHVRYIVDVVRGGLTITPKNLVAATPEEEVSGDPSKQYRLIYFRRVTHEISPGQKLEAVSIPTNIDYFLGYQWLDSDGKNHKRIMQITKDDEVFTC